MEADYQTCSRSICSHSLALGLGSTPPWSCSSFEPWAQAITDPDACLLGSEALLSVLNIDTSIHACTNAKHRRAHGESSCSKGAGMWSHRVQGAPWTSKSCTVAQVKLRRLATFNKACLSTHHLTSTTPIERAALPICNTQGATHQHMAGVSAGLGLGAMLFHCIVLHNCWPADGLI